MSLSLSASRVRRYISSAISASDIFPWSNCVRKCSVMIGNRCQTSLSVHLLMSRIIVLLSRAWFGPVCVSSFSGSCQGSCPAAMPLAVQSVFLFVGWGLPGVLCVCARRWGLSWVWDYLFLLCVSVVLGSSVCCRAVPQRLLVVYVRWLFPNLLTPRPC